MHQNLINDPENINQILNIYSRAMEGDGTIEKKWPKFGVKNFDHVF